MYQSIEYIDIFNLCRNLKRDNSFLSKLEIVEFIKNSLKNGVVFKDSSIKIVSEEYFNKFTEVKDYKHYFICPRCSNKVRKIYHVDNTQTACRKCCKIKSKTKINSQADRILKIHTYMTHLMNPENVSKRKINQIKKNIINHYNSLDDKYRFAYNTFVFKEIQNWCLDSLIDKNKTKEYKQAVKDMLDILRNSKSILIKTSLVKSSKKDFKL